MTDAATLLPPNASALERALATAMTPVDQAPVLPTLALPETIPAASLPWLAWALDVPWWPDSEAERRSVVARSPALHGQIGTAAGLKAGARLAGCEITHLEAHPATMFWSGWDEASRAAWLAGLPQLRIYARRARVESWSCQWGRAYWDAEHWSDPQSAIYRATSRVTLWQGGVETELVSAEWQRDDVEGEGVLRAARTATATGMHWSAPTYWAADSFPATTDAAARMWAIDTRAYRYPVSSLDIRVEVPSTTKRAVHQVAEVHELAIRLGIACWSGVPQLPADGLIRRFARDAYDTLSWGAAHWTRSDPETRMYRLVYLHDPDASPARQNACAFWDVSRFGMPPWGAQARLRLPARRAQCLCWGDGLPAALADTGAFEPVRAALPAMAWFRAPQAKILLDTKRHHIVTAGQRVLANTAFAGPINLRP